MKNFLLLIITITTMSCINDKNKKMHTTTFSPLENVSDSTISIFDKLEYTTLETTEQSLFGAINKLIVSDDYFFILDKAMKKKIFVFAKDGTFIRTIGSIGKGPGEYTNIEDFTIDETTKNIVLLCFPSTVIIYNSKGEFVSQKKLSSSALLWNICSYKKGYLLSSNHQSVIKGDEAYLLFNYDKSFNLINKRLGVLPEYIPMPPFVSNPLQNCEGKITYFDSFTSNVYLNINQSKSETISLNLGESKVPLNLYKNPQDFFGKQRECSFLLDAIIIDNYCLTSFANSGERNISIINLANKEVSTFKNVTWFPVKLLFNNDKNIYSSASALSIIKDDNMIYKKKIKSYPIDASSNPVILEFNLKYNK